MEIEEWDKAEEKPELSVAEMDLIVTELRALKEIYDAKKEESNRAEAEYEAKRQSIIAKLVGAGKSKYQVDGIGTVSVVEKLRVRVPQTPEDKAAMFKWFKDELGAEGFLTYATVNSNSLNSLFSSKCEEYALKGENFSMPGIEQPTLERTLSFRKK